MKKLLFVFALGLFFSINAQAQETKTVEEKEALNKEVKATCKTAEEKAACKTAEEKAACKTAEGKAACKTAEEKAACKTAEEKAACKTAEGKAACKTAEEKAACKGEGKASSEEKEPAKVKASIGPNKGC